MDTIFLSMLNRSLTASLVIFVVLLARLLLKKVPKIFSYALWVAVLFRLICPFSFESALGLLPINKTPIPQDIVYYEGFQAVFAEILENSNTNSLADFEAIKIGTQKDKIHEQFGEPDSTLFGMHGDVYIVGDKRIILYYGFEGEDSYPVTDVKIEDYILKSLTYDKAVSFAPTSIGNRYLEGECIAEGHIILGYDDSDETKTKIYAFTMFGWYSFENNNFVKTVGNGFIPVILCQ